jgi:biopolymer transport protein ExbD
VKLKRFDTINVIPFIDIMLVLLVIVLTTATFIYQGHIKVDLPAAKGSAQLPKTKEYTISITKEGNYFFEKKKLSLEQLKKRITDVSHDDTILLMSDKEANFHYYVTLMSLLKDTGHEKVVIVTKN